MSWSEGYKQLPDNQMIDLCYDHGLFETVCFPSLPEEDAVVI